MDQIIRWGIWGTGSIARQVAADFPLTRNSKIHAVASRSLDRAQRFAAEHNAASAYQGLDALLADRSVDVVYIATPHRCHAPDAIACLRAGKPVLCEKPFTLNTAEAERVVTAARENRVFCMEAMWTRFIPAIREVKRLLNDGAIGSPRLLQGNFSFLAAPDHDVLTQSGAQGGGALLDIGVYLISLAHHLLGPPDALSSAATLSPLGADEQSVYQLSWPNGALGDFAASLRVLSPNDFLIAGDRGSLHIEQPFYRPHRFLQRRYAQPPPLSAPRAHSPLPLRLKAAAKGSSAAQLLLRRFSPLVGFALRGKLHHLPFAGNGYQFQIDEVAACLHYGRTESAVMPLEDSLAVMRTLDQLRAQWTRS